jgi:hypothetical protein
MRLIAATSAAMLPWAIMSAMNFLTASRSGASALVIDGGLSLAADIAISPLPDSQRDEKRIRRAKRRWIVHSVDTPHTEFAVACSSRRGDHRARRDEPRKSIPSSTKSSSAASITTSSGSADHGSR